VVLSSKPNKSHLKGALVAALDVGSSKTACFIARVIDGEGNFEILGVGHHVSKGIGNGVITDLNAAEASIRQTVHAAESMAAETMKGYPLREVVVNVSGQLCQSHSQMVDVQISGHEITQGDVTRALGKAQDKVLSVDSVSGQELIHTIPVGYSVDDAQGIRDPKGMVGKALRADIHMVTADMGPLRNMASCVAHSHLDISALCVSSYAAGLGVLTQDEIDLGCTVIDMGGGVTSTSVFHNGGMVYCNAFPIGGNHVTSDIALGLNTSMYHAERLKALYGNAVASLSDEQEMIDVPQLGEGDDGQSNHVSRSLLVGIIQPRLEEILEMVRAQLSDSGLNASIGRRVVITGGGSQLSGLRDLAGHVLDKQVRLGRPVRLTGLPDAVSGPAFASAAGLLSYACFHGDEMPSLILKESDQDNLMSRVRAWLRENW
jgi:cell division protein FtsA